MRIFLKFHVILNIALAMALIAIRSNEPPPDGAPLSAGGSRAIPRILTPSPTVVLRNLAELDYSSPGQEITDRISKEDYLSEINRPSVRLPAKLLRSISKLRNIALGRDHPTLFMVFIRNLQLSPSQFVETEAILVRLSESLRSLEVSAGFEIVTEPGGPTLLIIQRPAQEVETLLAQSRKELSEILVVS